MPVGKSTKAKTRHRSFRLGSSRNAVGERVRTLRKRAGLTQRDLAARCHVQGWDVDQQMIANLEGGVREVTDLELLVLCRCLQVRPDELLVWPA